MNAFIFEGGGMAYLAVAAYHGLRLDYLIDTHTHADHRSGIPRLTVLIGN